MNILERAKQVLLYDGLTKDEYYSVEACIIKENNKRVVIYNYVAFVAIFVMFVMSFFSEILAPGRLAFLIGFISNAVIILLLHSKIKNNIWAGKIISYYFVTLLLGFSVYLDTVANEDMPTAIFFTLLALTPYITYSKVLYGFIHRLISVVIFIILDCIFRNPTFLRMDLMLVCLVFILSTFASIYFQKLYVSAYIAKNNMDTELRCMAGIFENIRIINLLDNTSADYSVYDHGETSLAGRSTNATEQVENFINTYVCERNRESMRQICNLATIEDRMYDKKIIEHDFINIDGILERVILVVIEEDKKGFPTKLAFTVKRLADKYYIKDLGLDINRII